MIERKSDKFMVILIIIMVFGFGKWMEYLVTENIKSDRALVAEVRKAKEDVDAYRKEQLTNKIKTKYNVEASLAENIVHFAFKHQQPVFPRATDLLAIISIESSFRLNVSEKLAVDPGRGLFQQRLVMWGKELPLVCGTLVLEKQFQCSAAILSQKYKETGNKHSAVSAYNQGVGNYNKRGIVNAEYVSKYQRETTNFKM